MFVKIYHNAHVTLHMTGVFYECFTVPSVPCLKFSKIASCFDGQLRELVLQSMIVCPVINTANYRKNL